MEGNRRRWAERLSANGKLPLQRSTWLIADQQSVARQSEMGPSLALQEGHRVLAPLTGFARVPLVR